MEMAMVIFFKQKMSPGEDSLEAAVAASPRFGIGSVCVDVGCFDGRQTASIQG
jgi:hypothetical protein